MFQTYLIQPLYNAFIFLIDVMPHGDVGLAIIAMTVVMRVLFYPAFSASIRTQMGMAAAQGELDEINKKYKDNPDEKAKHTMALFKERNIRPLAGFVAILVQIPIFIALYYAFFREDGGLPHVATTLLYSFVSNPVNVNLQFLGFLNLSNAHNIILALVVGLLQYAVIHLSLMRTPKSKSLSPEKAQAQAMQQKMMLYFMPGLFAVISFTLPSAAGLYFATGNVISLGQEWLIRRELRKKK